VRWSIRTEIPSELTADILPEQRIIAIEPLVNSKFAELQETMI